MKIYLSPEAAAQLEQLLNYLEENWSERIRNRFLVKFRRSIETIRRMPKAFPLSEKKAGLRRCVVVPRTKVFYRIKTDEIEIVAVIDARQNFD